MSKRIARLLKRDNYACGMHVGGCGKNIERNEATQDHIIPKNYIKTRDNSREFIGDWNYQPMHAECNEKREGQIINKLEFKCTCHGVYVDEQGGRWVMYREGKKWKEVKYWSEKRGRDYTSPPVREDAMNRVNMILGRRGNKAGVSILKPGTFGHMFNPMWFYERLEQNGFELERTEQWEKLAAESETFAGHYLSDGGESLKRERGEHSVYTAAKFVYWSCKAQSKMTSRKESRGVMELLKQKVNHEKEGEYPMVKKVMESNAGGLLLVRKETPPPVGWITFHQPNPAAKLANEALKYFINGENNKAEKIINQVVQEYPRYAPGWEKLGLIKADSGNLEEANGYFTKAIDLQEMPVFYASRAETNRRMGNIKQAKMDIELALAMEEKLEEGHRKYEDNFVSTETGKPVEREAIVKIWRETETRIRDDEQREEYTKLWKETRECLAKCQWQDVMNKCEDMFERYKRDGVERFAEKMKEYKDDARAEFYWMRMIARISLEDGFLTESCRLYKSLVEDGGLAIEQEMAKEIYTIDLDDFSMLTEKVKQRTSRMVDQLVEEERLIKTSAPQNKNIPKLRWKLIRPLHGKD